MKNVAIIGAGAAGMMAAAVSAGQGNRVTLIEKMPRPGRKLMITGKGRCNLTNACFDLEDLVAQVTSNQKFLYSAFSAFMPYDTIALFESLGVPTKIERGGRVFPVSDRAVDVVDALVRHAKKSGASFVFSPAEQILCENGRIAAVQLQNGEVLPCDSLCIATGGKSYPGTGSAGDGYRFARSLGHTVTPLRPGLVGLVSPDAFCGQMQGLSLKNAGFVLLKNGKEVYRDFGELLFTHYGVSGPVVLSASSHIDTFSGADYTVSVDLKPALDDKKLDERILRDFSAAANRNFSNALGALLPAKMIPVVVARSGISADKKVNQITHGERAGLVRLLKNFSLRVTDFRPIEEAIITRGGVDVREIDPKTMRSKRIDNLYFAGEVLDVDAYTGGYNLQIAFSTGYLCGKNM